MLPIPVFNPGDTVAYPNGNGVINVGAADAGSKMLLYNESPFNINIDFLNGNQSILHAWEARFWTLDGDTRQVEWDINSTLNVTSSPISLVIGELYNPTEKLEGTYPMGLIRQTNVGNVGGVATTTTQQLINDGNALLQVIEATLSGHASSDVIISNDGSYTLKGAGMLAALGILTHILGTLTVDQAATLSSTLAVAGSSSLDNGNITTNGTGTLAAAAIKSNTFRDNTTGGDQLDLSSTGTKINGLLTLSNGMVIDSTSLATEVDYNVPNTSKHTFEVGGAGARIIDIKSTGIGMYAGKNIGFASGSIQRIGFAAFSPPSGISTITHNFGFVPDIALWQGGNVGNTNPGTTTAAIYNLLANTCTINNFAAVNGFLLYLKA